MKMVKSRNKSFLNLNAPLTEKSVNKVPSPREAWGYIPSFWSHYFAWLFSREFLENIFLKGKIRTNPDLIYQLGKPYLRSSKILSCWNPTRGESRLKPGMVPSHGWVERGSFQVIFSSNTEVRFTYEFLMLVIWVCRFNH